jgi:ribosomal protein S18 acetylase RimI-like enzyme
VDRIVSFREAALADVKSLARLRSAAWGSEPYWDGRITGYMTGSHHPHDSLVPRVLFVAEDRKQIVGFVAGHLTRRFGCDGELQWLDVAVERRRTGLAAHLLRMLATWFDGHAAKRICVDVAPDNVAARAFYVKHGAKDLNRHWLVWPDMAATVPIRSAGDR